MRAIKNKAFKKRLTHLTVGVLTLPLLAFGAVSTLSGLQAQATPGNFSWQELDIGVTDTPVEYMTGVSSSSDGSKIAIINLDTSLYTSSDSGATWKLSLETTYGQHFRSITSSDSGSVLVTTDGTAVHTSNNWGETWSVMKDELDSETIFSLVASNTDGSNIIASAYDSSDNGLIFLSTDYGQTWERRNSAGESDWESIGFNSDGTKIVATSYDTRIYTSEDFGLNWSVIGESSAFFQTRTASSDDGRIIASTRQDGSYLYLSLDHGQTWEPSIETTSSLDRVSVSNDGSVIVLAQMSGSVYLTADSGGTWSDISPSDDKEWRQAIMSSDGHSLTITTPSKVFFSSNQGQSWSQIQPTKKAYPRSATAAASSDGTKLLAVIGDSEYGDHHVYTSVDSGSTWTESLAIEHRGYPFVASDANETKFVIIARNGTVYTSYDLGTSWSEHTNEDIEGLEYISFNSDGSKIVGSIYPNSDGIGFVFASDDSGHTWKQIASGANIYIPTYNSSGTRIAVAAVDPSTLSNTVTVSSDGGETWEIRTPKLTSETSIDMYSRITYIADETLLISGANIEMGENGHSFNSLLYISQDDGITWQRQLEFENAAITHVVASVDGSNLIATVLNNPGPSNESWVSHYRSSDNGQTWAQKDSSLDLVLLTLSSNGKRALAILHPEYTDQTPLFLGTVDAPSSPTPTLNLNGSTPTSTNPDAPQKITNKRPTFSGVAYPFAEVTVTVNSDPIVCTTTADANGNWSCTLPSDIPTGVHTVTVQVTNPDTNDVEELGPYYIQAGETVDDETPVGGGGGSGAGSDPNAPNTGAEQRVTTNPVVLAALAVLSVISLAAVAKLRKQ